jgi:RNA polymerase sigma-70 factor (ECF subfamily)
MQPQTGLLPDDASGAELYQRHAHTLLTFIRRYTPTREDAEDVLLEVFMAAFGQNALAHLRAGEQLAWLRRVARNKCVDLYRRKQSHLVVDLDSVIETLYEDEERDPEWLVLRSEEHDLLRQHLATLPPQQQTVIRLRFAHDLRCVEIARRLNKNESAVRMLLSRALNLLRGTYGQQTQGGKQDEPAR